MGKKAEIKLDRRQKDVCVISYNPANDECMLTTKDLMGYFLMWILWSVSPPFVKWIDLDKPQDPKYPRAEIVSGNKADGNQIIRIYELAGFPDEAISQFDTRKVGQWIPLYPSERNRK